MTSRCNPIAFAAACLMFMMALWAMPAQVRAQAPCACDHYTIRVDPSVSCKVQICWAVSPFGQRICQTVAPGGSVRIPCPVYQATITTCTGSYALISDTPWSSICTEGLSIPGGCCVRGCWGIDREGCPVITLAPWHCTGASCL